MAALGSQTIASSYEQLLHVDADGGGNGNTLVNVKDGDNGTTFGLKLSTNKVEVIPSAADDANAFEVSKNDGTAVLTVNTSTAGATLIGNLDISKDSADTTLTISAHHNTDSTNPKLVFKKSGGTSASPTLVADGESLGKIEWQGYNDDGTGYDVGGHINFKVDATPSSSSDSSDMPTQMLIALSPDGSDTPTTRLNILSSGSTIFYKTDGSSRQMTLDGSGNLKIESDSNVYLSIDTTQSNGDEWQLLNAVSGTTSGLQFKDIDTSKVVMLLQEDGKVGIGNTAPDSTSLLTVGTTTASDANGILINRGTRPTISGSQAAISCVANGDTGASGEAMYLQGAEFHFMDDDESTKFMVINSSGMVGIGDASPESYLDIEYNTVTSSASLNNLNTSMIITGGGSDSGDNYYGQYNYLGFNHSGSFYGELNGGGFWAVSDTTSGGEGTSVTGGIHHAEMKGGTDVNQIRGSKVLVDIDAGTIDSSAYGIINQVDMESGVGGTFDVYGYYSSVDSDTDRPTYSHYHESYNNVDYHWVGYSAAVPSITWRISAAGQIQAEGSIDASASLDYAEYFESKDGKAIAVGTTVKLDGDKIVACEDGDTPIGVIRPLGASGVVGGSQHFHWQSKFEKDDYDGLVMEDFTWTKWKEEISFDEYKVRGQEKTSTDDGSSVTLKSTVPIKAVKYQSGEELPEGKKVGDIKTEAIPSKYYRVHKYHTDRIPSDVTAPSDANVIPSGNKRPKLNSSYDPSKAESYKSREERDEWCIVGLLGQIPITKGQPLASNWIKMKDVSDTVEMYFVK